MEFNENPEDNDPEDNDFELRHALCTHEIKKMRNAMEDAASALSKAESKTSLKATRDAILLRFKSEFGI